MVDLRWEEVRCFFDPELMGGLPDVHVPGASVTDWQSLFELIRSSGWSVECFEGADAIELPSAAALFQRSAEADQMNIWVRPIPEILAIFRPWAGGGETIDFDVDLSELQGQRRLDDFCRFLAAIGRRLGKPVLMSAESSWQHPVLGFDPDLDRVLLLAEPWVALAAESA
ncbi:hypothetical protein KDL01_07545 [Actinospica durhamensis]|uniref:Uncharacterized protein n=1 Tax=Actinospica durhamensis TaxID=1508375 RepID=A0A941IPG6_9ACTN|nr:hypothetical protein [Actinospica durhamensis]MBR7833112.1 hypothetical protein [Actinospica durhamensis]